MTPGQAQFPLCAAGESRARKYHANPWLVSNAEAREILFPAPPDLGAARPQFVRVGDALPRRRAHWMSGERMSTRSWILAGALSAAVIATVTYGFCQPPPGADPRIRIWPAGSRACGSAGQAHRAARWSDCRLSTDYRAGASGYEAMVAGRWIAVPQDKILRGITNPTGRAVVCARSGEALHPVLRDTRTRREPAGKGFLRQERDAASSHTGSGSSSSHGTCCARNSSCTTGTSLKLGNPRR